MKCPHCPTATLVITERSGIEIDYCPQCRGVWLDRGELEKLLERAQYECEPAHDNESLARSPAVRRRRSFWLNELFD